MKLSWKKEMIFRNKIRNNLFEDCFSGCYTIRLKWNDIEKCTFSVKWDCKLWFVWEISLLFSSGLSFFCSLHSPILSFLTFYSSFPFSFDCCKLFYRCICLFFHPFAYLLISLFHTLFRIIHIASKTKSFSQGRIRMQKNINKVSENFTTIDWRYRRLEISLFK